MVWWDVDSDSEKIATLPSETLNITAGSNTAATSSTAQSITQSTPEPTQTTSPQTTPPKSIASATDKTLLWWQIATALAALLWLVTLFAYLQLRRLPRARTPHGDTNASANNNEENAWKDFVAACRANNPAAARQKLLQWAAQFYGNTDIRTTEQLSPIVGDAQLTRELQLLDNRLFGALRDSGDWNGENLLQVAQQIRKRKWQKNNIAQTELPPLYPAA